MNAKEAKELAVSKIDSRAGCLMTLVLNKIKTAATEGAYDTTFVLSGYSSTVINKVDQQLSILGYKVSQEENFNSQEYFSISWE